MTLNRLYLFLTLLVIVVSGNPAVDYLNKELVIIMPAFIILCLAIYKRIKFTRRDLVVITLFTTIILIHFLEFGSITINSSLGLLLKILTALILVRLIPNFTEKYVTAMYGLAIMSLIFIIPVWLGVDLQNLFKHMTIPIRPGDINIGLHNFTPEYDGSVNRNRGMFWEPGAFAGYLILALLFTLRNVEKVPRRYFIVIIAALLSTQSTTGYLAFSIVVTTIFIMKIVKSSSAGGKALATFSVTFFLLIAATAFNQLPFLEDKITNQFQEANEREGQYYLGRYGNLLYDLKYIGERPFFGWSALPETRQVNVEEIAGQGNGLSGYALKYGFVGIFGFIFFSFGALSINYGSKKIAAIMILVVSILLTGEQFLNYPIFLSLMFIQKRVLKSSPRSSVSEDSQLSYKCSGYGV